MDNRQFLGYTGRPDIHDGYILGVQHENGILNVKIEGSTNAVFFVQFNGVHSARSNRPVGMMLYALSEWSNVPPLRYFCFNNWEETDDAFLEVVALSFNVVDD